MVAIVNIHIHTNYVAKNALRNKNTTEVEEIPFTIFKSVGCACNHVGCKTCDMKVT